MNHRIGVAVIGTGYMGQVHIEQLLRLPQVRVAGVMDANRRLAQDVAAKYSIPTVYSDVSAIFSDTSIATIHNCTPNSLHYELNRTAIAAGKHVLSEKPLALNSRESAELVQVAQDRSIVTGVNFCYRYYPVVQEAAVRVRRGDIGEVYNLFGAYFQDWLLYETDYSWRLDPSLAGASNIVGDLGSHWCDLAHFISGLEIVEVLADLRTTLPTRKRPKEGAVLTFSASGDAEVEYEDVQVELDEYAGMLLRFSNGSRGSFTTSQLAAGRKCYIDMQIYGAKGSVAWNHERSAELWLGSRDGANQVFFESPLLQAEATRHYAKLPSGHPMGYKDAVLNLFEDFYAAVEAKRDGRETRVACPNFRDGHREVVLLEAAIESMRTGEWTRLIFSINS